tara:strand:- start:223 stop:468 length:246 start_codon:yes stop_codon:yes gene_type:complete
MTTQDIDTLDPMRRFKLLCAFQALQSPAGMYGATQTQVRQIIADLTGLRLRRGATPPDGTTALEGYLSWAQANLSKTNGGA